MSEAKVTFNHGGWAQLEGQGPYDGHYRTMNPTKQYSPVGASGGYPVHDPSVLEWQTQPFSGGQPTSEAPTRRAKPTNNLTEEQRVSRIAKRFLSPYADSVTGKTFYERLDRLRKRLGSVRKS